ncbi:MAG: ester cyclase [bacterium]
MANPESIVREMVDAINRNDMAAYMALLHPEYSYRGPDNQVQRGPDAGVAIVQMYRTAFPDDLKVDIQHIHAAGDTAVVEFIGGGTHRGELAGVAPTGPNGAGASRDGPADARRKDPHGARVLRHRLHDAAARSGAGRGDRVDSVTPG